MKKIPTSFFWYMAAFAYAGVLIVLGGCGASMPSDTVHGTAAGEWHGRLPSTPSPFASMAYGRDGSGLATRAEPTQLDAYLKPEYRERARAPKPARMVAPSTLMAAKTAAPEPHAEPMVASAEPVRAAAPAMTPDAERYAERDASAAQQKDFKAGDAVVLSLGSILIIALIVILLVLLLR